MPPTDPWPQERGYSAHDAYSLSKLANILFTFELADRLARAGSAVTCNCLDPGGCSRRIAVQHARGRQQAQPAEGREVHGLSLSVTPHRTLVTCILDLPVFVPYTSPANPPAGHLACQPCP